MSVFKNQKDEFKHQVKDGEFRASLVNVSNYRWIGDIFERQAEIYRSLGRIEEAAEASKKAKKCRSLLEAELSSPDDELGFCD